MSRGIPTLIEQGFALHLNTAEEAHALNVKASEAEELSAAVTRAEQDAAKQAWKDEQERYRLESLEQRKAMAKANR